MFVELFVREIYKRTKQENRKQIQYKDIVQTVKEIDEFEFLTDILPEQQQQQQQGKKTHTPSSNTLLFQTQIVNAPPTSASSFEPPSSSPSSQTEKN
jgi:hypothetical protein